METLWLIICVALAAGGLAYVFILPLLSGEAAAERRRRDAVASSPAVRRRGGAEAVTLRRQQVEDALKEIEARRRNARRPPLQVRLAQAGLGWSPRRFIITCVVLGGAVLGLGLLLRWPVYLSLALASMAGLGLPRWLLGALKRSREKRFLLEFPNAVDIIVRGVRSGLPLSDCLRIIAAEAQEPVRAEFRAVVETQALGVPLAEACGRMFERVPLAEISFFAIVVAIQGKAGGNLSEALGNLSRVLRDRRRMREKIQAMSMEAKASAVIIAALPVLVMVLVYLTTPSYISLLWTEPLGRIMLAGCAVWMLLGVLVMRRMINFDF